MLNSSCLPLRNHSSAAAVRNAGKQSFLTNIRYDAILHVSRSYCQGTGALYPGQEVGFGGVAARENFLSPCQCSFLTTSQFEIVTNCELRGSRVPTQFLTSLTSLCGMSVCHHFLQDRSLQPTRRYESFQFPQGYRVIYIYMIQPISRFRDWVLCCETCAIRWVRMEAVDSSGDYSY